MAGRERLLWKRLALAASLAALWLTTSASPAGAAVTIGELAPASPPNTCMGGSSDSAQPSGTAGNSYVVPSTGGISNWTVTSWSTSASATLGQMFTLKVFRHVSGSTFTVVGHDGPRPLTAGVVNTFPANVPVKPGDFLGNNGNAPPNNACLFSAPGESRILRFGSLADGESGDFITANDFRVNAMAVLDPANTFTLGAITRNKKKGTATLTANVPNPGELTGSGKGVKVANAAVISKTVTAPGNVRLTIRAKGKQKATLDETGKVKVKPKITYTPTGGDPATQSQTVKLRKKN